MEKKKSADRLCGSVTHYLSIQTPQTIKQHEQIYCRIIRKTAHKRRCKHLYLKPWMFHIKVHENH